MPTPPVLYYTEPAGPGAAAEQPNPGASLGGYASTTEYGGGVLHDLFNRASSADAADARVDHRCLYVHNPDPGTTLADVRVYLTPRTAGATGFAVGADSRPPTYLDSLAVQAVTTATGYAAPTGVTFATPTDYAGGVALGDLPPLAGRAVWLRRTPAGEAGAPADAADVTVAAADGTAVVRRVYWETEPYAARTEPTYVPPAAPVPSPFRRVAVDFLTAGGTRVTWDLDRTMTDPGPYVFQLQGAHSGVAAAADWVDVGPPARDAPYLLDPAQRLWGMSETWHYRVVLTTPVGTYVSPPAPVFGRLDRRAWLVVTEVQRKEALALRALAGSEGYLLKAKRYGTRCSCVDPTTGEVNNSQHPACYGTGIDGGYHPALPLWFVAQPNQMNRERVAYNEGTGTVNPTTVFGRAPAVTPVVSRDVWVARDSDERYLVHEVRELAACQGTPVVYGLELRLLPRSHVLYALALDPPPPALPPWQEPEVIAV